MWTAPSLFHSQCELSCLVGEEEISIVVDARRAELMAVIESVSLVIRDGSRNDGVNAEKAARFKQLLQRERQCLCLI